MATYFSKSILIGTLFLTTFGLGSCFEDEVRLEEKKKVEIIDQLAERYVLLTAMGEIEKRESMNDSSPSAISYSGDDTPGNNRSVLGGSYDVFLPDASPDNSAVPQVATNSPIPNWIPVPELEPDHLPSIPELEESDTNG